jgi:hypothetical protein
MSQPDSRRPTNARGAFPSGLPEDDFGVADAGGIPGVDAREYEEWHCEDAPPRGPDHWGACRNSGHLLTGQIQEYSCPLMLTAS